MEISSKSAASAWEQLSVIHRRKNNFQATSAANIAKPPNNAQYLIN